MISKKANFGSPRQGMRTLLRLLILALVLMYSISSSSFAHAAPPTDREMLFRCDPEGQDTFKYISMDLLCDGKADCKDGSDENDCEAVNLNNEPCGSLQFNCGGGDCIPLRWVCDGTPQCYSHADELNCPVTCPNTICRNQRCIPEDKICNAYNDCGDNSDELNCTGKVDPYPCVLSIGKYQCHDKIQCIYAFQLCNGEPDCNDGSDEGPNCTYIQRGTLNLFSRIMSDAPVAVAPTTPKAKTPKKKGASKPKKAASHPPTAQMVNAAIKALKEKKGSSLQAIKKDISTTYKVDVVKLAPFIRKYVVSASASGKLVLTKGKGAAGSFKLPAKEEKPKAAPKEEKILN